MTIQPRQLGQILWERVWRADLGASPWWQAGPIKLLRALVATGRDLLGGDLTLRAMSLVYTTLLSLVPLLAFSFSVLKAFGAHNQIEPLLYQFLAPLGDKGLELGQRVIGFVENIKVGVLGTVGLALLIYTVISLLHKVEQSFNFIWQVRKARRLGRRFTDYLSVVLIGPVLVVAALGLTASMMSYGAVQSLIQVPVLGPLVESAGKLVPYTLVIAAFIFSYVFMPNTHVRLGAAAVGGLLAGAAWQTSGWAFSAFVVGSTKYTAIYSSFAILIIFMIWLYVSWLILLAGASIAYYWQNPARLGISPAELRLSGRMRERIGLSVMLSIARHFYGDRPAWTAEALAQSLRLPSVAVDSVLHGLLHGGLIVAVGDEGDTYLPARDLEQIKLKQILDTVQADGERGLMNPGRLPADAVVDGLEEEIDRAVDGALAGRSLRDLVAAGTNRVEGEGDGLSQAAAAGR